MTNLEKNNLRYDIDSALAIIKGDKDYYTDTKHYRPYLQTNEPLGDYFPYFELQDKDVLTVTGSGDQVLEAIRFGAKKIVSFDQNKFAYYVTSLKLAAVKTLSANEYISYLCYYSLYYYKKLRPFLEEIPQTFWDTIFANVTEDKISYFFENYFESNKVYRIYDDCYYDKEPYEELRAQIPKVSLSFLSCSLSRLPRALSLKRDSFDVMFLSNIYDWYGSKRRAAFPSFITYDLAPFLKDGGKCCAYFPITFDQLESKSAFKKVYLKEKELKFYIYPKK